MAQKSLGFAVGNVRARENFLLTKQDLDRFITLTSQSALVDALIDGGYSDIRSGDINDLLEAETAALWDYVFGIAPDMAVLEPFIMEYDYHNAKTVLKAVLSGADHSSLTMKPSTVPVELIEKAVKEKKYDILPPAMGEAVKKAGDIISGAGDSQLADGVLDAAMMTEQQAAARRSGVPTVGKYFKTKVFINNAKIALRAARAGKNAEFLDLSLGGADAPLIRELKNAALHGEEAVLEVIEKYDEYRGAELAEAYKLSASEFERCADNILLDIAREGRRITLGAEPIVGYLLAKLTEIQAVGIIAAGIRTGRPENEIRERLRELYG